MVTHLVLAAGVATAAEVSAFLDRTEVAVGESAVLSIQVIGSQNATAPQLSGLGEFRVQYIGPTTEMRIENGRATTSITHRYHVFPQREGNFRLGPFPVDVDGATVDTQALILRVAARGQGTDPAAGSGLTLDIRVGRDDPFVGERVRLTIRLLIPDGVRVDDLQFPTVAADGLMVGPVPQPSQRDETIGGRRYRVLHFETHLTPNRPVEVELRAAMGLSVLEQQRGRRGVFGGMMGGVFAERRPLEVRSDPVMIRARALPTEGRPPGFNGAVGTFDLRVSASPTSVTAGDPITVRVEVVGEGDLSRVQPPRIAETEGFRVYDPVVIKDAGEGTRGHEQVVIPRSPEITSLPTLAFSFFDSHEEAYRTVHRGPIDVEVAAAASSQSGVVANGESGRAERAPGPLGRDIVYIKGSPGAWRDIRAEWTRAGRFWAGNALPVAIFALLWWRTREQDLLASNPKLRRFRAAEANARTALASIEAGVGEPSFYDGLARSMAEYLGAKLDLAPGAVDAAGVSRALGRAGYSDSVCRDVEALFAEVEARRYAPAAGADADSRALVAQARRIIDAVEQRKDLGERLQRALCLILSVATPLVLAAAPGLAGVGSDSDTDAAFFAGNHAYADERYDDALASYQQVLAAGRESGALHFNTGNVHFKRGDAAAAVASYLRAARLLPRDPDVAANLSFAEESLDLPQEEHPLWQRVLFAVAYRFTEAELALAFTLAWCMLWAAIGSGFVAPRWREPLRVPVRILCVVVAAVLLNLGYRGSQLELWTDAVVTGAEGAAVRFEPDESGTEHFAAPPGSRLRIAEERDGWILVARADGRRGWVAEAAVTRLR
jgi:tetratricopeptide (TPR) repeat protein